MLAGQLVGLLSVRRSVINSLKGATVAPSFSYWTTCFIHTPQTKDSKTTFLFFPADVLAPAVVRGTLVLVGEEDGGEPVFLDAVVGEELEPQAVPLRGYHLRWDRVIKKRKRTFFARLDLIR